MAGCVVVVVVVVVDVSFSFMYLLKELNLDFFWGFGSLKNKGSLWFPPMRPYFFFPPPVPLISVAQGGVCRVY